MAIPKFSDSFADCIEDARTIAGVIVKDELAARKVEVIARGLRLASFACGQVFGQPDDPAPASGGTVFSIESPMTKEQLVAELELLSALTDDEPGAQAAKQIPWLKIMLAVLDLLRSLKDD